MTKAIVVATSVLLLGGPAAALQTGGGQPAPTAQRASAEDVAKAVAETRLRAALVKATWQLTMPDGKIVLVAVEPNGPVVVGALIGKKEELPQTAALNQAIGQLSAKIAPAELIFTSDGFIYVSTVVSTVSAAGLKSGADFILRTANDVRVALAPYASLPAHPVSPAAPPAAAQPAPALTSGSIVNGVYTNEQLGLSMKLPKDWPVIDQNAWTRASQLAGPDQMKGALLLVGASHYPLETGGSANPWFFCIAEARTSHPQVAEPRDYLVARESEQLRQAPGARRRELTSRTIGGQEFGVLSIDFNPVASLRRVTDTYATFRNAYILTCTLTYGTNEDRGVMVGVMNSMTFKNADALLSSAEKRPPPPAPPGPAPIRVGGGSGIPVPKKIKDVEPVYPPIAQSARVQGFVTLDITIGPDGSVTDATVLKSIPLLDAAAIAAVRQWRFEPTLRNGVAISVKTTVLVNFSLKESPGRFAD